MKRKTGRRGLESILCWADQKLREIFVGVERRMIAQGVVEELHSGCDLLLSRLTLPGCAYVANRVATAGVEKLSPQQRMAAELVILKRMPRKLAARQLGISLGTLRTHLDRIHDKIGSLPAIARQLTLLS